MEPTRARSRPARAALRPNAPHLASVLRRFAREEDGVIVAFSVYFMLIILLVGAIGVDVMRYESQRSRLQHVLDQAVLAAADLDQLSPPAEVVADYFAKSGLPNAELLTTVVDDGINYREVRATAREVMPTQLSHMLGIAEMSAPAASAAREQVDSVEISLVLDISGSMRNRRIQYLRPAAVSFVDTVLALSDDNDVSISLVPYATQVSAGQPLLSQFNRADSHDYSHCINFEPADFTTTAMFPASNSGHNYQQTMHFDVFAYANDPQGLSDEPNTGSWWRHSPRYHAKPICHVRQSSQILPVSNDVSALHNQINALVADGNTSMDIGVKWGAALLDPSLQPVVSNLVASNTIDNAFEGRPLSYDDPNSIKVLVLMTDGQNTSQYIMRPHFRTGNSDVYYNASNDRYAVFRNERYYYQTESGARMIRAEDWSWSQPSGFTRLPYQDLFARVSLSWIAAYFYQDIDPQFWNNWYAFPSTPTYGGVKDNRLQDTCDAAKNNGIVVYTIGFQAPEDGIRELLECASSPSHFFDVEGLEIEDAFSAIAQSISQLKLIQ
ncbi:pilus assembly protein TadG-related protein [Lentibacter sp.]|uniref:pilus assembly protein TadG-related protein n=1 Tax=Lentibacter sp. TaxID=2024994 RepID=UPI003F6A18FB